MAEFGKVIDRMSRIASDGSQPLDLLSSRHSCNGASGIHAHLYGGPTAGRSTKQFWL